MDLEWTTSDTNYQYRMERTDRLGRRHSILDTYVLEACVINSLTGLAVACTIALTMKNAVFIYMGR